MSWKSASMKEAVSPLPSQVVPLHSHAAELLRILKVLTLSNQLQDTDVTGGLFKSVWDCKQSKHVPNTSLMPSLFSTELSAAAYQHLCVFCCLFFFFGEKHVCLCVHVQWLTPPSQCQIKAWKIALREKGGVALAGCGLSYVINTLQLRRFMLLNIPGQVRLTATCGNMICF